MEVIIKPTTSCNFACTFCSAAKLNCTTLNNIPTELKQYLQSSKPHTVIVTGGEPLLVSVDFYNQLLELGNWNISITSNLKDFYQDPQKWKLLFKNKRVRVGTSFQYGNNRRWDECTPYDESMFIKVHALFEKEIGYKPDFIAVIDYDNEKFALKHVELAKKLGCRCKLNSMMPLGNSIAFYPQYKIIKILLDAIDMGYAQQLNMETMFNNGGCNFNTTLLCNSTIRAISFENNKMHISCCEDDLAKKQYADNEIIANAEKEQLNAAEFICKKCASCELLYLCHGCRQYRNLNKLDTHHCNEMCKLKSRILNAGWRLQP